MTTHYDLKSITVICFLRNVDTMDLFMLPREIRCRVVSLLLGAVKIERDQHVVSVFNLKTYMLNLLSTCLIFSI